MKYQLIRRAIALALALFLLLTMVPSMAVPARAADGPTLSIKVPDDIKWPVVDDSGAVTLEAEWSGGDVPTGSVRYQWTSNAPGVMAIAPLDEKTASVTPVGPGDAVITLTAVQTIDGVRTQIGTATLEVSVTSLVIKLNNVTAGETAQLVVGQGKATLEADWSHGRPGGIAKDKIGYKWVCDDGSNTVEWPEDGSETHTVTIGAKSPTGEGKKKALITVTAEWPVDGEGPSEEEGEPSTQSTSCELDVEVIKPQLGGIEILIGKNVFPEKADLVVGGGAELEAVWVNDIRPSGTITYTWECTTNADAISFDGDIKTGNPVKVTANKLEAKDLPITEIIKVTATWGEDGSAFITCTLTVKPVAVESIELNKKTLPLAVGEEEKLIATVLPEGATDKTVTWSSSNKNIADVDQDGKVTAVAVGTATITAKAGDIEAKCEVTVTAGKPSIEISGSTTIIFTSKTTSWTLSAIVTNPIEGAEVRWYVDYVSGKDYTELPQFGNNGKGAIVPLVSNGPGEFMVTASYVAKDGTTIASSVPKRVIISGIILSGPKLEAGKSRMDMYVGDRTTLTVEAFGDADSTATKVEWSSSDSSVVSVMNNNGNLNAWSVGTALIRATKGDYSASCTVVVGEDESVIAGPYKEVNGRSISPSNPLKLSDVDGGNQIYTKLNNICKEKTKEHGEYDGDGKTGFGLKYITNLQVSPNQGTLYYNYSTESDPGFGVGYNDQFAKQASGAMLSLDRLYFVPKQGFAGTAEITFSAIAANGRNIAGVIRVEVGADVSGPGDGGYEIIYQGRAGEAIQFLSEDFSTFCQSRTGRDYSYVTFNLPKSSEGVLYYNYVAGTGNPVSITTQFTPSGRNTINDVCFVPNAGYEGEVKIGFRVVDTAGDVVNDWLTVVVDAANVDGDLTIVTVTGERGRPVTLQSEPFNAACKATVGEALSFVTFKLPDESEGTLYYNYQSNGTFGSRVTETARYYYSGSPGLGSVSFVPATNTTGRVAISYTGHGAGGATFSGTLYIELKDVDRSTIYYSAAKGGAVTFSVSDFIAAGQHMGYDNISFVVFTRRSSDGLGGTLRFQNSTSGTGSGTQIGFTTSVSSTTAYFVSPTGSQRDLSKVFFQAGNTAGIITIEYTAYSGTTASNSRQKLFDGKVEIRVGVSTPEDIELSCNAGGQAELSASDVSVSDVCGAVMSGSLAYIEITSVPDAKEGHLYYDYNGFGTGTMVKAGDRYYGAGSSGIDQLTFIPFARFTGQAEITYIGYSVGGEQVSGRIVINVTQSEESLYFNDIGSYTWAVDSIDYLYRNGTVNGVGGDCFNPRGTIRRGDFVLMLVRAFNLTARGSASFNDVPAGSYYADAIRIAALLDIVSGYNGNFNPKDPLTRQDAMVMIYKTLRAEGKITTNGLTADLSGYSDEGQISAYAKEAMGSLVLMGVVEGDGSTLRPRSELKRAEAAILLHTIMTL